MFSTTPKSKPDRTVRALYWGDLGTETLSVILKAIGVPDLFKIEQELSELGTPRHLHVNGIFRGLDLLAHKLAEVDACPSTKHIPCVLRLASLKD